MKERLTKFGLTLNATNTRLIQFGLFAATNRKRGEQHEPETFDFLGFVHCCGTDRQGRFQVTRLTVKKRMRATLEAIRAELMRRRDESVAIEGKWLNRVVQGYFNYRAVPGNLYCLALMRSEIGCAWRHTLMRRSQRHRLPWHRFSRIAELHSDRP
jgi:RNA-directed DNA polymerase